MCQIIPNDKQPVLTIKIVLVFFFQTVLQRETRRVPQWGESHLLVSLAFWRARMLALASVLTDLTDRSAC